MKNNEIEAKVEVWNGHSIGFVQVNQEWQAVASDVARAMGFADAHTALRRMPDKYKGRYKVPTLGGWQEATTLTEKGLYRLIMRSNKPDAEDFQDWVYDVITTLRKSSNLEGYQMFRLLDKEHQKQTMSMLSHSLANPKPRDYIKANTIANKAIINQFGYPKMVKKNEMTPAMLQSREAALEDTEQLMEISDKFHLNIKISAKIYEKYGKEMA